MRFGLAAQETATSEKRLSSLSHLAPRLVVLAVCVLLSLLMFFSHVTASQLHVEQHRNCCIASASCFCSSATKLVSRVRSLLRFRDSACLPPPPSLSPLPVLKADSYSALAHLKAR